MLSQHATTYLNAVVNPFGADAPAQIPDMNTAATISVRDYLQGYQIGNYSSGDAFGVVIWLGYGGNVTQNTLGNVPAVAYSLNWAPLDSNLEIVRWIN
jgi:hypothetical protein